FNRSPESVSKFSKLKSVDKQYEKLMKSMAGVLNFRPGNEPTSLTQIVDIHRKLRIGQKEFEEFYNSFLETIDEHFLSKEVRDAWERLLRPVIEYMQQNCVRSTDVREKRPSSKHRPRKTLP